MRVTQYNDLLWSTPANEKTVYNVFSASKLHEPKSGSMTVECTDFLGRKIRMHAKNRPQLLQANAFMAQFKQESNVINEIKAQYNVKNGKYVNACQLKNDLIQAGLTPETAKLVIERC